jgi:hypothetical protein
VRLVWAEDFGQGQAVNEALAPLVQLVTAGGADPILKTGRERLARWRNRLRNPKCSNLRPMLMDF